MERTYFFDNIRVHVGNLGAPGIDEIFDPFRKLRHRYGVLVDIWPRSSGMESSMVSMFGNPADEQEDEGILWWISVQSLSELAQALEAPEQYTAAIVGTATGDEAEKRLQYAETMVREAKRFASKGLMGISLARAAKDAMRQSTGFRKPGMRLRGMQGS